MLLIKLSLDLPLLRSNVYKETISYLKFQNIFDNFVNKRGFYQCQKNTIKDFIWENFSAKDGIRMIVLRYDQLSWKRNFILKKYLEDKEIARFQGNKIIILAYAERLINEAKIEYEKFRALDRYVEETTRRLEKKRG